MDDTGDWRPIRPRLVWVLSRGRGMTPLPAWPGIQVGWLHAEADPPKPRRWMGLVIMARESGSLGELRWVYDSEIQVVAEHPPVLGGDQR